MTLCDAGPLIAIIDADEPDHDACLAALDELTLPLVTTWPAFTEAMYLLGQAGGITAQRANDSRALSVRSPSDLPMAFENQQKLNDIKAA